MSETATPEPESKARGSTHLRRLQLELRLLAKLRLADRHTIYLWAALVGFTGAWAALGFQYAMKEIQLLLTGHQDSFVATFYRLENWQRIGVPVVGALCAGLILMFAKRFVRERATDYMEVVSLGDGTVPVKSSLIRTLSALFSIASGGSIGREGPLVQLAAVGASMVGRLRGMAPPKRRLLVACGAAAGVAAAYHAPLGGAIFVAEIVIGSFAMESMGPLLISSVVAVITLKSVGGSDALYHFEGAGEGSMSEYILCPLLGIICGAGAAGWMWLLRESRHRMGAIPVPIWIRLTLGGLIVGILALRYPEVTGNGASVIQGMLSDRYTLGLLALILLLKIAATCAVFGSGAVGGVFTPTLLVGAGVGVLFADVLSLVWPGGPLAPGTFAIAGMTALLASAAQAPFTAIVLLFEMTARYDLVLPLAIASVSAYATTKALGADSLYSESLRLGPRSIFDRPLVEISVKDIMRPAPPHVKLNAPFADIARAFLGGTGRELWVVSGDGHLYGEILLPDVEPYLKEEELAKTVIAGDLVHEGLPSLLPELSLPLALEAFSRTESESLAVLDVEKGKLIGSVSRADLFITLAELTRRERARVG